MDTPAEKRLALECLNTLLESAEDIIRNVAVIYSLFKDSPDLQPEGTLKAQEGIESMKKSIKLLAKEFKDSKELAE